MQGAYCGGWRRCACLDAETRVLAVRALASTTCNHFIADLLFLSGVPRPFLVAGPPCVDPSIWGNRPCARGGRGPVGLSPFGPIRPMPTPCQPHANPMPTPCQPHANPMPTPCQPHANPMPTPFAGGFRRDPCSSLQQRSSAPCPSGLAACCGNLRQLSGLFAGSRQGLCLCQSPLTTESIGPKAKYPGKARCGNAG
jgi:hypothetical protein